MKKTFYIALSILLAGPVVAQQAPASTSRALVKWAPTGLIFGDVSLQGEFSISPKHSITLGLGIPAAVHNNLTYQDKDADFRMKATTASAGYRAYLGKKPQKGFYVEPFAKYVHHSSHGVGTGTLEDKTAVMNFTNEYKSVGVGAQLGAQFFVAKRFVVDVFFLGPQINSANSHFRAVEASNTIPWTSVEASDAEDAIRSFVDQFPFVRNNTNINVDRNNRTVTADFKGAIPGVRAGVSIGFAL